MHLPPFLATHPLESKLECGMQDKDNKVWDAKIWEKWEHSTPGRGALTIINAFAAISCNTPTGIQIRVCLLTLCALGSAFPIGPEEACAVQQLKCKADYCYEVASDAGEI
eukprot:1156280-Pelagomonas_calceolata.AAC.5